MLAGRKLLLADDSITIQKVVELTFADEGVSVVCVNNGREAIERLEEFQPDVVLADVFMPQLNGYEVCQHIKQNDRLKHIPVMLLVGSFEPFDEAEARRVGADDTLTKPFQSIRRLLEKVGILVSARSEEQTPTAELPKAEENLVPEPEKLSEQEIEVTTADTQPLPNELVQAGNEAGPPHEIQSTKVDEQKMDKVMSTLSSEAQAGSSEPLLDLGDFAPASASAVDDFVLDIDLDEVPEPSAESSYPAFAGQSYRVGGTDWGGMNQRFGKAATVISEADTSRAQDVIETSAATADQMARTQEFPRPVVDVPEQTHKSLSEAAVREDQFQHSDTSPIASQQLAISQFSPEVIDAIARRAVEQLSEKVVQEIAWEVVPQLAELMIKRQLEEKNS